MLGEISSTGDVVYFTGQFFAERGQVVAVVIRHLRENDFAQWMKVEIFLRDVPGQVRLGKSTGEKKRFVVFFFQLGDGPVDDLCVQEVAILVFHRTPRCPGL